ncbi:hypothetical protein HZS_6595 [Henneguya salminicola]|nr:hypothetical protein HZS_6595 [Henneguya salminicola]
MVDILHMSYLCPIYFYCKTIQNQISSSKPEIILPYLLIDLQDNGLEAIMSHYELIYDKFNVKKITNRFENGVKEFVDTILKNYC